jgi:hypothetical protein
MVRHSKINTLFKPVMEITQQSKKKYRKQKIPVAIREAVWTRRCGRVFQHKCFTSWCPNVMTVFDFQCGHNVPESKGGRTVVDNLYPLCSRCNTSMGDRYTIDEWNAMVTSTPTTSTPTPTPTLSSLNNRQWKRFFCFSTAQRQTSPDSPASPSTPAMR